MNEKLKNYNLLVEQWIPVLGTDGRLGRVGIREALTQAGRIRQIAACNPMDRAAILRFLLAVLYWCKGNPPHEKSTTSSASLPANWFSKLEDTRDCFNLLGGRRRFYQCVDARLKSPEKLSANYLIHEIPTGTNKWHFRHTIDKVDGLCLACCAMGLLRLPLFATSGGRGKPPGINSKPPLYVFPTGASLAATLRLLWREVPELGTPSWEEPDQQLPRTGEVPLLVGLTWLPRRVWLDDPTEPEASCSSCGQRERLIRSTVFAGIGSTRAKAGGSAPIWSDPHVIYAVTSKGDVTPLHASDALGAHDAAADQWTRIVAGVMIREKKAFADKSRAWVVGFSTVQNDKYLEALEYVIPSPSAPHQIQESTEKIERWRKEDSMLVLVRRVRPPNEMPSSGRKHVEIPPAVAAIRPHVEGKVSAEASKLFGGGNDVWEEAAREYRPLMAAIAQSLSPGFTTAAVQRRRQIAHVTPYMGPKTEAENKLGRGKGEER